MINKIVRFFTNPNARYNLKRKILERTVRKRIVKRM